MDEGLTCAICRHWRRVGPRSAVGRCENRKSDQSFTRERSSCPQFEILMFVAEAPPVHLPA